jgi:Ca2+-binding RTX toxin-like protein
VGTPSHLRHASASPRRFSATDKIDGGPGRDDLLGYGERDLILGDRGIDDLNGGRTRDRLRGQRGNDTLTGENPPVHPDVRDKCQGGPGRDRRYFC